MKDEQNNEIPEEELGIIELTDEDGETTEFEYLSTIEHEGQNYLVLMEVEGGEENEEESGEVVILKVEQDEKGEDMYVTIDDEAVMQAVFDKFLEEEDEE